MRCQYCNKEMETGKMVISATGSVPIAIIEWYSSEKCEKGFFGRTKSKRVTIRDRKNGNFDGSYYCHNCCRVFGEFETREE